MNANDFKQQAGLCRQQLSYPATYCCTVFSPPPPPPPPPPRLGFTLTPRGLAYESPLSGLGDLWSNLMQLSGSASQSTLQANLSHTSQPTAEIHNAHAIARQAICYKLLLTWWGERQSIVQTPAASQHERQRQNMEQQHGRKSVHRYNNRNGIGNA